MKVTKKISINKPASAVWKTLAQDFDRADTWMAAVPKSYQKVGNKKVADAPVTGRICELSTNPKGLAADETITNYDESNHLLGFSVIPTNVPKIFPIIKNDHEVSLREIGENKTEVTWNMDAKLKKHGYLMYPMLKFGLGKGFGQILEELKFFVENDAPHPRKAKKIKDQIAA
ncbi:MAG: SRPBCC family protein [Proteobacteria bacterium]|nr:SRPBCC family protein [Pseudomonadota bacterium]